MLFRVSALSFLGVQVLRIEDSVFNDFARVSIPAPILPSAPVETCVHYSMAYLVTPSVLLNDYSL